MTNSDWVSRHNAAIAADIDTVRMQPKQLSDHFRIDTYTGNGSAGQRVPFVTSERTKEDNIIEDHRDEVLEMLKERYPEDWI